MSNLDYVTSNWHYPNILQISKHCTKVMPIKVYATVNKNNDILDKTIMGIGIYLKKSVATKTYMTTAAIVQDCGIPNLLVLKSCVNIQEILQRNKQQANW